MWHAFVACIIFLCAFLCLGLCFHSVLKSAPTALRSPFVGGWAARPFNHILSSSFSIRPPPHATCFPSHSFPLSLPQSLDNVQIKQRFLARRKGEGREGRGRDTVGILKGILGKGNEKKKKERYHCREESVWKKLMSLSFAPLSQGSIPPR